MITKCCRVMKSGSIFYSQGGNMSELPIRDMTGDDEYFVSTCSHVNETDETDAAGVRRLAWLKKMQPDGLRVKVALHDDRHVGFLYVMPIEICPWGPIGKDLMVVPCLWVLKEDGGQGAGKALLEAAEEEAKKQNRKALVIEGYRWDFFFMPAAYFEKNGYTEILSRGQGAVLWKMFDDSAEAPIPITRNYEYKPIEGKVVIDLFWHSFCLTCNTEAQRVREVVAEFGDKVVFNEHCADDREVFMCFQTPRAIFINGKEIGWGYEAPREGIKEAIEKALGES